MKKQFYFKDEDSEICYNKEYFIRQMKADGLKCIEVFEAIRETIPGIFWCKEYSFCGEGTFDTCGKDNCKDYLPRNKISGVCKHHTHWLYCHGDKIILNMPNNI